MVRASRRGRLGAATLATATSLLGVCACSGSAPGGSPSASVAPEPGTSASRSGRSLVAPASSGEAGASVEGQSSAAIAQSTTEPPATAPASPPVLAVDSVPAGVEPLDAAEREELRGRCKPLSDAVVVASRKADPKLRAAQRVRLVMASPPHVAGVDMERCARLLERDLLAYEVRTLESEAINHIKRIVVGLAGAMASEPGRLCPSAPAVPARLATLETGAYTSSASEWAAEGWRCVRFDLSTPQRFQYELRTRAEDRSYEILARGYPVPGAAATELVLAGRAEQGAIQPSSDVYRRR